MVVELMKELQHDNKIFLCTTDSDGVIGSSNITYSQITAAISSNSYK